MRYCWREFKFSCKQKRSHSQDLQEQEKPQERKHEEKPIEEKRVKNFQERQVKNFQEKQVKNFQESQYEHKRKKEINKMAFVKKVAKDAKAFEHEGMVNFANYTLESKRTICIVAPYTLARAVEEVIQAGNKKKIVVEKSVSTLKFQVGFSTYIDKFVNFMYALELKDIMLKLHINIRKRIVDSQLLRYYKNELMMQLQKRGISEIDMHCIKIMSTQKELVSERQQQSRDKQRVSEEEQSRDKEGSSDRELNREKVRNDDKVDSVSESSSESESDGN
eukprot:gene8274-9157_t